MARRDMDEVRILAFCKKNPGCNIPLTKLHQAAIEEKEGELFQIILSLIRYREHNNSLERRLPNLTIVYLRFRNFMDSQWRNMSH